MANNNKLSIFRYGQFLLAFVLGHIVTRLLCGMEMFCDEWRTIEVKNDYNRSFNDTFFDKENQNKPPTLYGHVHMMKTGGTTLNGLMAVKYERVCGHKGYSYDAFQDNERRKNLTQPIKYNDVPTDSMYKLKKWHYRHVVPLDIMDEIGYEDCDWVSFEDEWTKWTERFTTWPFPVELHVPCRDPIDHLMSQRNMIKLDKGTFDCAAADMGEEIEDSLILQNRFSMDLLGVDNFHVKCFSFDKFKDYIAYMEHYLQKRKIQREYVQWETNDPRDKDNECIWKDEELKETVKSYLLQNHDYYKFCKQCIGSDDDLFAL